MIVALSFWASWAVIGTAVAVLVVFYKVLDLSASAFSQWRNAAPGQGEDLTSNRERER